MAIRNHAAGELVKEHVSYRDSTCFWVAAENIYIYILNQRKQRICRIDGCKIIPYDRVD